MHMRLKSSCENFGRRVRITIFKMSNVQLAIRVRPFTDVELKIEKDRVPVVNVVDHHIVTITNIKVSLSGAGDSRDRVRRYFADYTFDSCCCPTDPAFASQERVFERIGRSVLDGVSRGLSACVLAYGQSATGKTHTMMGTEGQPGLVPRLCRALAHGRDLNVTVSFLEIYNERVHDLLAGEPAPAPAPLACRSLPRRRGNALKDLRVREHPSKGPYVQNLRRVAVNDVDTLLTLVDKGTRRRRTAATRRNSTSSRSHALLELTLSNATLHLADLAGSEKASWEGCGGGQQKEGSNINKSLVALSNVISALVSGGNKGRFVPYRDSALTWLLKDCFTGGARTFIIATISPSVACYGESASTLRWAARAKQLPTLRVSNSVSSAASRNALQAQLNQLLAELSRNHIIYTPETGKISYNENHWALNVKRPFTETKIGSFMSMFPPKAEANNSESAASSVASGSSDTINKIDKNIYLTEEINEEVDKIFGPALERARSGGDLKVVAPFRNKRRQYKSQEVLSNDKTLLHNSNMALKSSHQSQDDLNSTSASADTSKNAVPILYDNNQRAEIVASVTERLYSKLKKKEEVAVSKMESLVDRKIMEPLSELRICTNARQRLVELSHKALRNKRRMIGIPAHTQTKRIVTRVKDQGIDVQTDLDSYVLKIRNKKTYCRDVATETIPITPRCKEIAVGSASIKFCDRSTVTETKPTIRKNSCVMTDILVKYDRGSQTPIVSPLRRKKQASMYTKYIKSDERNCPEEYAAAPVISINISQPYSVDSDSLSDDSLEDNDKNEHTYKVITAPDLLSNHNNVETSFHESNHISKTENLQGNEYARNTNNDTKVAAQMENKVSDEFPELEEYCLPRVSAESVGLVNEEDMKDMILGRSSNSYPYSVIVSPPKETYGPKRVVKFKGIDIPLVDKAVTLKSGVIDISSDTLNSEREPIDSNNDCKDLSDSTDSSKADTDSFIWKRGHQADQFYKSFEKPEMSIRPIFKNLRHKTARSKFNEGFLGLKSECNVPMLTINVTDRSSSETEQSQDLFRQRRQFFEDKFKSCNFPRQRVSSLEQNVLESCKSLDTSVDRYEKYLSNCRENVRKYPLRKTPTDYLQHLLQLRKNMVKSKLEYDTSDSSTGEH